MTTKKCYLCANNLPKGSSICSLGFEISPDLVMQGKPTKCNKFKIRIATKQDKIAAIENRNK